VIKIIKIFLWALAFIPLMVDNLVFSPYITGESLFLRGILVLTSILFLSYFFYKKKFRDGIAQKIKLFIKNPLVISILVFIFITIISTIFAIDKYSAFWGNIERAEGLVGILFFFSFFVFSLLIFEKKDWFCFFKLTLLVSFIVLFKEFWEFFSGIGRPGSFFGNPTFLAGYLLFSIFCALVIFSIEKNKFFKIFSIGIFILSILGIFIAETRGTILGLAVGFVAILIYCIFKGKNVFYKKFNPVRNREGSQRPSISNGVNLRKISIIILCFLVIFSAVFISTRKNEIWQKVPGFSRVATTSGEDASIQPRLLMWKLSIEAINPVKNGLGKFLIGWGPENFVLVSGKYFNPEQFKYENTWLDRSHNKLLDVLVMNGLLGLMAYLSIWFFLFRFIFKRSIRIPPFVEEGDFSLVKMSLLFFSTSFFVHLLFIFDQISTSIPFFTALAFAVYFSVDDVVKESKNDSINSKTGSTGVLIAGIFLVFLTLFLCFIFFRNTLPAYFQMRNYLSIVKNLSPTTIESNLDSVFYPFTTAQMDIRRDFLKGVVDNYNNIDTKIAKQLFEKALIEAEEYINKRPLDLRFLTFLARIYSSNEMIRLENPKFIEKGEKYFRKVLIFAPNRSDLNYGLALNLTYQNEYKESFDFFEKAFKNAPNSFSQDGKTVEEIYIIFIQHFYKTRDKENFIKTANRLKENNYIGSAILDQIIEYIEKNNKWPIVDFEPA